MNTTDLRNTDRTIAQIITASGRGWHEWEIADRLDVPLRLPRPAHE